MYSLADRRGLGTYPARPFHTMLVSPRPFRVKVRCCFNHFATSGLRLRNKRRCASMAHFSDCPFPNPPGSFHCNGLSSFQKPLRTVWKRITRQQPLPFCTPCHPCRVRGQVLVAQEHQPLPAEPDLHRFDASGSPRVPLLVFQRGRYAMSDSLRLSYSPRWIFS